MIRMPVLSTAFWTVVGTLSAFAGLSPAPARADTTVQIPVASILNCRPVTTFTGGKISTWTIGIDGNGNSDGYLTAAASAFMGDKGLKSLPDSGIIHADARHPEVVLNYSDADSARFQGRYVRGTGDFAFAVPEAKYSKLFLFFTSSEGASTLSIDLTYADATIETKPVTLPDYFDFIPATDTVLFNLVADLPKWNKTNVVAERTHHNLDGIELHPSPAKTLASVKVSKTAKAYLVFWGATGIATSPVTAVLRSPAGRMAGRIAAPGQDRSSVLADGRRMRGTVLFEK